MLLSNKKWFMRVYHWKHELREREREREINRDYLTVIPFGPRKELFARALKLTGWCSWISLIFEIHLLYELPPPPPWVRQPPTFHVSATMSVILCVLHRNDLTVNHSLTPEQEDKRATEQHVREREREREIQWRERQYRKERVTRDREMEDKTMAHHSTRKVTVLLPK